MLKKGLKGLYYYLIGHLIALFRYDKKYLTGRWFTGKMDGLCSHGWRWVVHDAIGCRRAGINDYVKWPVSPRISVVSPENIFFSPG